MLSHIFPRPDPDHHPENAIGPPPHQPFSSIIIELEKNRMGGRGRGLLVGLTLRDHRKIVIKQDMMLVKVQAIYEWVCVAGCDG